MSTKLHAYFGFYIQANIDREELGSEWDDVWVEVKPSIWIPNRTELIEKLGHWLDVESDDGYFTEIPYGQECLDFALPWFDYFNRLTQASIKRGVVAWYM